jgi:hypothetical protein
METQEIDEGDWIKLMDVEYIIYIFSTSIRYYVYNSWNLTKNKINNNNNATPIYKSLSSFMY